MLLPPPKKFYTATGEEENEGTAAKPRITQILAGRAVDDLIPTDAELVLASGKRFRVLGGEPFATFWRAVGDQFYYQAYLREKVGSPLLSLRGADRVAGTLVKDHGGTILLLPQRYEYGPDAEQADGESDEAFEARWEIEKAKVESRVSGQFIDALLEFASELRGSADVRMPEWAERVVLPGEQEAADAVNGADDRVARAQQRAEKARSALKRVQRHKLLITGTGGQLEDAVERALEALGCTVESGLSGRVDRIVRWKHHVAVVEIKGLSKSARERDAAQLEKWASEYLIEHDQTPKGILLVNAWRTKPIDQRDQPAFPDQMIPYAESRNQSLVTTSQLLAALVGSSTAKQRTVFLRTLFETVGVVNGWDWSDALTVTEPVTKKRSR